ncbi:1,2-phenylacetyl-CoA epoxidase subunit PaaD [Polycladidibacter hongkongensis]|uniref:1,2-phenylacetyl-CoA epoxidase subunit PaaD n=1 Tax=Polycladidibacter hongkongensis TaxID=1647556 RepID=UPI00082B1E2D|nr:1,2-phenylacetyl-CoA epoxidase subunit PaaD [Pseudovibrio hongkongensis]
MTERKQQAVSEPDLQNVWQWLEEVPDPEIPVLSLVDLGVIRSIEAQGGELVVAVSPTYSGCPATRIIHEDVAAKLREKGLSAFRVEAVLSPPWSSEWISKSGRKKLAAYGIAPPQASGKPKACPQCGSAQLELVSQFGSTPCKASWRCLSCLEPFDYFKCI